MTDKLCWCAEHLTRWPQHDRIPKVHPGGHLWCSRKLKMSVSFQHTLVRPVQCAWEGLSCRRPWPVPAAVAPGRQRCRHGPPRRSRRAGADQLALCGPSPCREQTGGPRQAQPRARRETEIKFTLGLLSSVQCAENVGTKFTQGMQSFRKVCSRCDQKQKKFSQQVKTLRNSLQMNC